MAHKNYETNVYRLLKRKGLAPKYECAGIYCIKIDDTIVYIGKSHNMLMRISQHYVRIKSNQNERKYRIMAEAQRKGHSINFDVLYYATARNYYAITEEIGRKEGEYIRKYSPVLNTQIPKVDDWRSYDVNFIDARGILNTIL